MNYIPLIAGSYMILMSFLLHTRNVQSTFIFKAAPFFLGLGCMYTSGKLLGWL